MALHAGSYDKSQPLWLGIIRDDGAPMYECFHILREHRHQTRDEAKKCARDALVYIKETGSLPEWWSPYVYDEFNVKRLEADTSPDAPTTQGT
jgi:hypothetical protein